MKKDIYLLAKSAAEELLHESGLKKDDVLSKISSYMEINSKEIMGSRRTMNISFARHAVAYIYHVRFGLSLNETARVLNREDHTTIINSVKNISDLLGDSCPIKIMEAYKTAA